MNITGVLLSAFRNRRLLPVLLFASVLCLPAAVFSQDTTPPAYVSDLSASVISPNQIWLDWTAPGNDGTDNVLPAGSYFIVQNSTYPEVVWSTETAQDTIDATDVYPGDGESYQLNSLLSNTSYFFRLWTLDDSGNLSAPSNLASGNTLAALPGSLSIVARSSVTQDVSWGSGGNPEPGTLYRLEYSVSDAFTPGITTTMLVAGLSAKVSGLLPATSYYYDVAAVNLDGIQTAYTGSPAAGYTLIAQPGAPAPLSIWASSISWNWAAVPGATGYNVYAAGDPYNVIGTVAAPLFTQIDLSTNTLAGISVKALALVGERSEPEEGAASAEVSIYTQAVPPLSVYANAGEAGTDSINLRIDMGGNPPGTMCRVDYWAAGGSTTTLYTTEASTAATELTASTSYYFLARAVNESGLLSGTAGPFIIPTLPAESSGLVGLALSTDSIRWSWAAVPTATSYRVYTEWDFLLGEVTASSFTQTGLTPNSLHSVKVRAVNISGEGNASAVVSTYTLAAVPVLLSTGPAAVEADRITVQWDADGNASDTVYNLSYWAYGGSTVTLYTTETSTAADGLAMSTSYYFTVLAVNNYGVRSASAGPLLMTTLPVAPAGLAGAVVSTQAVRWSWAPVVTASSYRLYNGTGGFIGETAAPPFIQTGLPPNTLASARVSAVSPGGEGAASVPASTFTLTAMPGPLVIEEHTQTMQTVSWAPNGNPLADTVYHLKYSTSPDFAHMSPVVVYTTYTTISELKPGTSYYYDVYAVGSLGIPTAYTGLPVSGYTSVFRPVSLAISGVYVSSHTLSWESYSNPYAATVYTVKYSTSADFSAAVTTTALIDGVSRTVTGLVPDTSYYYDVSAANAIGETEGFSGSPVAGYTRAAVPDPVVLTGGGATSHAISWGSGGNPVPGTSYIVRYSLSPGFESWATTFINIASTYTMVTGLEPGVPYYYDVAAVGHNGVQTAYSGSPTAAYTLALPPTGVTGLALGVSSISWTWNEVPGAAGYNIYYQEQDPFLAADYTTGTSYVLNGIDVNTLASVRISAVNALGESELSSVVSTYTLSAAPLLLSTGPAATTLSTLAARWNANGNAAGTVYEVDHWAAGGSTETSRTTATGMGFTGLTASTSYYIRVSALNHAGVPSAFAELIVPTLPAAPAGLSGAALSESSIQWNWPPVTTARGYAVYCATDTSALLGTAEGNSFTQTGLSTNTVNGIAVAALNLSGKSVLSSAVSTYTLAALPVLLSTGPAATTLSSLAVKWGDNDNPAGTRYYVEYWPAGGPVTADTVTLKGVSYSGLTDSTSYYIRVRALNGNDIRSAPALLLAPTLPAPPVQFQGAALDPASISWSWTPVVTASGYKVYAATDGVNVIAYTASPSFTQTGLSTDTMNGIMVSALNISGGSVQSAAVSTYTLAAAPVYLSTGPEDATGSSLSVQWGGNGNAAGTLYRVDHWAAYGSTSAADTPLNSATINGLTESVTYYIRVRSLNTAGMPGAPAQLAVPTLPAVPAGLSGTVQSSNSIRWGWSAVTTAIGYDVYLATAPGSPAATVAAPSYIQTGLLPNATYSVRVGAVNRSGTGQLSTPVSSLWTFAVPPAGLKAVAVYVSSVVLNWSLEDNPALTQAELHRSTDAAVYAKVFGGASVEYTDEDLQACTTYYFKVLNRNNYNIPTAFTPPLTVYTVGSSPVAPYGLAAAAQAGGRIALSWSLSPSAVTSYKLYYDHGGGAIDYLIPLAVLGSTVTTYTTGALTPGVTYRFGLRANLCTNEELNTSLTAAAMAAAAPAALRAVITVPQAGRKVGGDRLTVMAGIAAGAAADVKQVRFQYAPSGSSSWLDISTATAAHPNPDTDAPYFVHWDVSALSGLYDLRAVAMDQNGIEDSSAAAITVSMDTYDPDISETLQAGGGVRKEQKIYNTVASDVLSADAVSTRFIRLLVPAGALSASTVTLSVTNSPASSPAPPSDAQGYGAVSAVSLSDGETQFAGGLSAALTFSYPDVNGDGIVDGTALRAENLRIYSAATLAGPWKMDFDSVVDLSSHTVTALTPHFSYFGLFSPLGTKMDQVRVYPVPFVPNDKNADNGTEYTAGDASSGIIFDKLPGVVTIKIYTVTGQLVAELGSENSGAKLRWDAKNSDGKPAASGGYLAVISSPGRGSGVKKLLIVR